MQFRLALTLLLLGSTAALAGGSLTEKAFKAELVGKTITWHDKKKSSIKGKAMFTSAGVQKVFDLQGVKGMTGDTGKWWYAKGKVCNQFKKLRKGKARCQSIVDLGNGSYQMGNSILTK